MERGASLPRPALAHDAEGNFYLSNLASDSSKRPSADSMISLYEMAVGSNAFKLVSAGLSAGTA